MNPFPFPALDFPGRSVVTVDEVAQKLKYHRRHIVHLIEDGTLPALDGKREGKSQMSVRIPIEVYRAFVIHRMTTDPSVAKKYLERAQEIINEQLPLNLPSA